MSYHIQSDKHWRVSKSGYSIKTGFAGNSRIVASYHAPHTPLDGPRFEQWLEDAQHACDLHNASIDGTASADARITELERECSQWRDELRIYRETESKRIAELERAVTVRDTEIARLETDLELARRDAERLDWFRTLTPHKLARIRAAFMPDSAGDVRATIDAARAGNGGGV